MKKFLPVGVLLALGLALLSWFLMFKHLIRSEQDVAKTREREWAEAYLGGVAERFGANVDGAVQSTLGAWREVEEAERGSGEVVLRFPVDGADGLWIEESLVDAADTVPESFDKRLAAEEAIGLGEFRERMESGDWEWGWVRDGRDVVATVGLSLLRKGTEGDEAVVLRDLLWRRVTDYRKPELRPGFRLFLLDELSSLGFRDEKRARQAEQIRVWELFRGAEGRGEDLPENARGDVMKFVRDGREAKVLFRGASLEALLAKGVAGPKVELLSEREVGAGRPVVRTDVGELGLWIGLTETAAGHSAPFGRTERMVVWMGALSGILLVGSVLMAFFVARRELRLARLRTDLAASVAHELRTPLAGQRLLLETLLQRSDQSEEDRREYIEMAFRENERLGKLAEEFLTFSRLERGILKLESEQVSPAEVARAAIESLRDKWEDENCRLTVEVDENLPTVPGDRQGLITALRNLLENAWKYTGERKEISITGRETENGIFLAVRDNGVGLDEADCARIFRQFYRVDQRLSRDQGGLGLGLAIVKRLVEGMQGRVEVESEKGRGSEFRIWLAKTS